MIMINNIISFIIMIMINIILLFTCILTLIVLDTTWDINTPQVLFCVLFVFFFVNFPFYFCLVVDIEPHPQTYSSWEARHSHNSIRRKNIRSAGEKSDLHCHHHQLVSALDTENVLF